MPKCKGCGKEKLLLLQGLCSNCRKAEKSTKIGVSQIVKQVEQLSKEREKAVNIYWQYGGQYGKDCKSIGMKRGQHVELVPHPEEEDPSNISILWKNKEIAKMKDNRLRGMVHQWFDRELPVQCIVASVGGEQKLLLEFAFYGRP